jgi:hypothetical protein
MNMTIRPTDRKLAELAIADPTVDKPPRPRRWIPLSLKMFMAIMVLVFVGSSLWVGVPIYRQRLAMREIDRLDGSLVTMPDGPEWIRDWLDEEQMRSIDTVIGVDLSYTNASDETMVCLGGLSSLQTLSLDGTKITDVGLSHIKQSKAVQVLNLDDTLITDAGLALLADMDSLEELSLSGTQITDAGLVRLKSFTSLKLLHVARTQVTDAGIADLKRSLPNVDIWKLAERDPNQWLFKFGPQPNGIF